MSAWDFILVALICLVIFRGYFKGLCRRCNEWVGLIFAGLISYFCIDELDNFVFAHFRVDGREHLESWLKDYFSARVASNPSNQLETLKEWVAQLYLPSQLKENLYTSIKASSQEIYGSVYDQVARVLSDPLWDVILYIFGTVLLMALFILIGEVGGLLVKKLYFTKILDRFLGAIASGFAMVIVCGVFTALCFFIIPEDAGMLGHLLHDSFMAPILQQAVDSLLQGGIVR